VQAVQEAVAQSAELILNDLNVFVLWVQIPLIAIWQKLLLSDIETYKFTVHTS